MLKFNKDEFLAGINQTEAVCIEAVSHDYTLLKFVVNQTEDICIAAMVKDPRATKFVHPHMMRKEKVIKMALNCLNRIIGRI
jgi:hypothetical protein